MVSVSVSVSKAVVSLTSSMALNTLKCNHLTVLTPLGFKWLMIDN